MAKGNQTQIRPPRTRILRVDGSWEYPQGEFLGMRKTYIA